MWMNSLPSCLYVCISSECSICAGQRLGTYPLELELGCCESPCGYWELNSGHLQEQHGFVTVESVFQTPRLCFYYY